MTADERFLYEERAAIMEYDGNMPKLEAERRALADVTKKPQKALWETSL